MLFSFRTLTWKIADFGFTSQATSIRCKITSQVRDKQAYRAPEMLLEPDFIFNKKVDIWALGCILFELFIGKKVFRTDFATLEHYQSKCNLSISLSEWATENSESEAMLLGIINQMLNLNPRMRSSAKMLRGKL